MVTLMIGSNDFCGFVCLEEDMNATVRRHGEDLERALDHLQASLPRTIVNLIVTPNLESLMNVTHLWPQCYVTHRVECWCLFGSKYKARRREVVKIMRLWQLEERRVATSERYRQKEDFVVNLQPMVEFVVIPKKGNRSDLNFLSEDCFHLSQKGIAMGANGLWMNLLESDDEKSTTFPDPAFSRFLCPTEERPFISTWGNDGGRGPS
ncbi:Phospholipase B1, membrane-associated [Gryllus bimaculatus]|nr:Phospholipase B1, membrane-associated [Gryllus bimaculatus]